MLALALLAALAALAADDAVVVEPREASWTEMAAEVFDPERVLPSDDPTGFLARCAALAALSLDGPDGAPLRVPMVADPLSTLGDLLREKVARRDAPAEVDALLAAVARARPSTWAEHGATLEPLLRDDALFGADWDPGEDLPRDGFASGPVRRLDDGRPLQQAATLVAATAATWKAVENDYTAYPDHVGARYESIRPVAGTYLRGEDPDGEPFAALQIVFRCDLPFPFGAYACRLRVLTRVDDAGRLSADVYSISDDFHWLAGRDVFHELRDRDGEVVGLLVVRQFGFDLAGVPDGDGARRAAMRGGLGNLKRRAERAPAVDDDAPVPGFEVRGPRR